MKALGENDDALDSPSTMSRAATACLRTLNYPLWRCSAIMLGRTSISLPLLSIVASVVESLDNHSSYPYSCHSKSSCRLSVVRLYFPNEIVSACHDSSQPPINWIQDLNFFRVGSTGAEAEMYQGKWTAIGCSPTWLLVSRCLLWNSRSLATISSLYL